MDNSLYYLGFNLVNGIGPARLDRLVSVFGSLQAAWQAPAADLMMAGLDGRTVEALLTVRRTRDLQMEYSRILSR